MGPVITMRRGRGKIIPDPEQQKATESLKLAFKHEVRPQDYLLRVWVTAIVAAGFFAYGFASRQGHFDAALLLPLDGSWHSFDPAGGLYLETWGSILANSLQAGFIVWGGVLLFLGVWRAFNKHKYVFACFSIGISFVGFAMVLPSWTEILLKMLIEKCPFLVQ